MILAGLRFAILPEYEKGLYALWQRLFVSGATIIALLSPFYFLFCEITLASKYDIYRYIGRYSLITYLARVWQRPVLRQAGLMWVVKLFFLPIMFGSLYSSVNYFTTNMPIVGFDDFYRFSISPGS